MTKTCQKCGRECDIEQFRVRKRCSYQSGKEYFKRENVCAICRKKDWQARERRQYINSNWSPAMNLAQFERYMNHRREREREAQEEGRRPIYD